SRAPSVSTLSTTSCDATATRSGSVMRVCSNAFSRSTLHARETRRTLFDERAHAFLELAALETFVHEPVRLVERLTDGHVQVPIDLLLHDFERDRPLARREHLDVLLRGLDRVPRVAEPLGEPELLGFDAVEAPRAPQEIERAARADQARQNPARTVFGDESTLRECGR